MSEEREKREVGLGEKCEAPADAEIIDLTKPEEEEEVGGRRYIHVSHVMCPHCYSINRIIENPEYRTWFRCCDCAGTFLY